MSDYAHPEFKTDLQALIAQVEAWSYGDSDAGAGVPVELAEALRRLAGKAPTPALRRGLARAQDALDDGLSAEVVAGELYRVRAALSGSGP